MKLNSLTLAGCLAVAMAAAPAISLAGTVGHDSTFELLKDFQATAVDAANHAATLQSVTHDPNCDWQVHAQNLTVLKEDVNEMGRELTQLEKVRDTATPLEQRAIAESEPLLRKMAVEAQSAIIYLGENQRTLWAPSYVKVVGNLADDSEQLSDSVGRFLDLAKVHAKEDRLEKTLGVN